LPNDLSDDRDRSNPERIAREIERLKEGLQLLGLKQCCCCGRYSLTRDGKALFEAKGESACFNCIWDWWKRRSPELAIEERLAIEHKLLRWLVAHYGAKVVRQAAKMPKPETIKYKLIVGCDECKGTGKIAAATCSYCEGRGFEWGVILWPELA